MNRGKPEERRGKRMIVTELEDLMEVFSQFDINVVADDLAHESRQLTTDVLHMAALIYALVQQ